MQIKAINEGSRAKETSKLATHHPSVRLGQPLASAFAHQLQQLCSADFSAQVAAL